MHICARVLHPRVCGAVPGVSLQHCQHCQHSHTVWAPVCSHRQFRCSFILPYLEFINSLSVFLGMLGFGVLPSDTFGLVFCTVLGSRPQECFLGWAFLGCECNGMSPVGVSRKTDLLKGLLGEDGCGFHWEGTCPCHITPLTVTQPGLGCSPALQHCWDVADRAALGGGLGSVGSASPQGCWRCLCQPSWGKPAHPPCPPRLCFLHQVAQASAVSGTLNSCL